MRSWILVVAVLASPAMVACGSGHLGEPPPDPVSPGTVTVRLLLPSTRSFCDQVPPCSGISHVSFSSDVGGFFDLGGRWCETLCEADECMFQPCPTIYCGGPGAGVAVTGVEYTWNGAFLEPSTCGANVACVQPNFVLPGSYVAHLCATPGILSQTADVGSPICTATGPTECVDVPFNLPGQPLVEVALP